MRRRPHLGPVPLLVLVATVALAACGSGQKVGSEKLLEFERQKGAKRLGEKTPESPIPSPTGSPPPLALGQRTTEPPPTTAPPKAEERFFEVALVADSPYYLGNGEEATQFIIPVGVTVRVTNRDSTPERPERSFSAEDGSFSSPKLKFGDSWTRRFTSPGSWQIVDTCCPFMRARLDVG